MTRSCTVRGRSRRGEQGAEVARLRLARGSREAGRKQQHPTRSAGLRGFSTLELVLTVSIFGLLVSTSVPNLASAYRDAQRRRAVRAFTSTHALAKATALRYRRLTELHIDAANGRFWIEVDSSMARAGVMDTIGSVRKAGGNIRMTSARRLLCFDRRGLATTEGACEDGAGTVTFSLGEEIDYVTTTRLGKLLR